jgi:hypothetical protein
MKTGIVHVVLGIDSATAYAYDDGAAINLSRYATEVAKIVRPQFPNVKFKFSAIEDDNAETTVEFEATKLSATVQDEILSAVSNAEGETFANEYVWE